MRFHLPGHHANQLYRSGQQRVNWTQPLAQGLVGGWLLNGADRQDYAWDVAGVNHAWVDRGALVWTPGPRGNVLRFNGAFPSNVMVGNLAGNNNVSRNKENIKVLDLSQSGTWSIFTRARVPSAGFRWLVTRLSGSWLGISSGGKLVWTIGAGTDKLGATTVSDGLWHTLGVTWRNGTLNLYVDGKVDATFTSQTLSVTTASDGFVYFGHRSDYVEFFDGDMEYVYQWNRELSSSEALALHEDPTQLYRPQTGRFVMAAIRNPAATGARVTEIVAEVAYPAAAVLTSARLTQATIEVAYPTTDSSGPTALGRGSAQQVRYVGTVDQGDREWIHYQSYLGESQAHSQTYDFVDLVVDAVLVEDGDGIPPSGHVTTDLTPTLSWTAPTGAVGPFFYPWSVVSGAATGTILASGTTLNQTFVQVRPGLSPGDYQFRLSVNDGAGASGAVHTYLFTLLPTLRVVPPRLLAMDPLAIEPAQTPPAEYIRYLPQWLSLHGMAGAEPEEALFFRFWQAPLAQLRQLARRVQDQKDGLTLAQVPVDLPRLAWHLPTRYQSRDPLTVTVRASGSIGDVRRASSVYDFMGADDPVFLIGETGHMLLRNLALREVTTGPVSGSTGATGAVLVALSSQYQLPAEGVGMVADCDFLFRSGSQPWSRVRAGVGGVDPEHATIQLPPSLSGSLTFRYQSRTLLPVIQISVSGQPFVTPAPTDLWNRFDELAILASLTRRPAEDNLAFRDRVQSRFLARPGVAPGAVAQRIAQDLTLTRVIEWGGHSTLNFAASGIYGIRGLEVREATTGSRLLALGRRTEPLIPSDPTRWSGSKESWQPGWQVTVDGIPASPAKYPGLTASGSVVCFLTGVSGTVSASYQYPNYQLQLTAQGFIDQITPVSGNIVSGDYQIILTRNVRVFTPADPEYQAEALLQADGTPNGWFRELKARLLEGSPVHIGRARWGADAHWFAASEDRPPIEHLPSVYDLITP